MSRFTKSVLAGLAMALALGSGGAAVFPWLAGNLVGHLGYWFLLPFAFALTLLMWGLWFFLSRTPTVQPETA